MEAVNSLCENINIEQLTFTRSLDLYLHRGVSERSHGRLGCQAPQPQGDVFSSREDSLPWANQLISYLNSDEEVCQAS